MAGGFHPESGIFFTCSEDEAQAIVPENLSKEAVRDAYLFLADELFVDVALHERTSGMAALVAMGSSSWRQIETGFRGRKPTASLLAHLAALDALAANEIEWPKPRRTDRR